MSIFLRAAYRVLEKYKKPMPVEELVEKATSLEYLRSNGKTPAMTMKSKLSVDILKFGEQSRFMRTDSGLFGLREWQSPEFVASRYKKALFDEDIVVFPSEDLWGYIERIGITEGSVKTKRLLSSCFAMRRRDAEEDFSVIQLVSLFLVKFENKILTYKRAKRLPEARLHDYYSVTFGGHLNPADVGDFNPLFDPFDPSQTTTFMERELREELRLPRPPDIKYRGIVYDNSRDVSRQHLGILFEVLLETKSFKIGERGFLIDAKFETIEEIMNRFSDFENWSQLIVEEEIRRRGTISIG